MKYLAVFLLLLALLFGVTLLVFRENVRQLFEPSTDLFPRSRDGGSRFVDDGGDY